MKIALAWLDPADPTDRAIAVGLGRALRARGHEVLLVGPRRRTGEPARDAVDGLPLHRARAAGELLRLHRREAVDVWHCHVFARAHGAYARAAARARWPAVATPHLVLEDYLPFVGGPRGLRELLRGASAVTAVSRASRRELARLLPEHARAPVVYYGVAPAAPDGGPLPSGPYALCPARLAPYKGQDLLLMAFARVAERDQCLRLVLCGRDQLGGALGGLVRALRLERRVSWLGPQPPARVASLMRGARFVVLPSRRENLPLAALEALALGRPLVATRAGGVEEAVRHRREGLLVEPGDVSGLAAAMLELAADASLRRRLGRAALERGHRFSWDAAARAYERLYRRARLARVSAIGDCPQSY